MVCPWNYLTGVMPVYTFCILIPSSYTCLYGSTAQYAYGRLDAGGENILDSRWIRRRPGFADRAGLLRIAERFSRQTSPLRFNL